jgi:hypothetical protein
VTRERPILIEVWKRVVRRLCTCPWMKIPARWAGSLSLWSHRRTGVPGTPGSAAGGLDYSWRRWPEKTEPRMDNCAEQSQFGPGRVKANCSYPKGLGGERVHNASAKTKPISRTGIACPALAGGRGGRRNGGHCPPYKRRGDNAQNKAKLRGDGMCGQGLTSDCRTGTRVPAPYRGHECWVVRPVRQGGCVWTPEGGRGVRGENLAWEGWEGLNRRVRERAACTASHAGRYWAGSAERIAGRKWPWGPGRMS